MEAGAGARGRAGTAAWALAGLDAVVAVAFLAAVGVGAVRLPDDLSQSYPNLVFALTLPAIGAVVVGRAPGNRLGPIYLVCGTATALALGSYAYGYVGLVAAPSSLPGAWAAAWVSAWVWALGAIPLVTLGVLRYPDGALLGPRWRVAEGAAVLGAAGLVLAAMVEPGPLANHPVRDNPLGLVAAAGVVPVVAAVCFALLVCALVAAVASLGVRWRRGDAVTRAQVGWLLAAVALLVVPVSTPRPASPDVAVAVDLLTLVAVPLVPLALAVAVLRHHVFGLVVVRRSLTFGLLTVLLLVAYVGLVATADALLGRTVGPGAALVAAGLVAALTAPLRARLQAAVDRLLYGDRGDPHAALGRLGRRLEESGTPEAMLQDVAATVAGALRAPYVAVELRDDGQPAARVGRPGEPELAVPLVAHGQQVGRLLVTQRRGEDRFGPADLELLADLARHLGVAASAALLTRDLKRSRERLVVAREEERRRLSRDLHDGLGPALAGIAFGLDAVRKTLPPGAADLGDALATLRAEVAECLADVRRLVNGLRPPVLDQLGLVPAVRQSASRLTERGALDVTVDASPATPPALPAAVEVAVYRIVVEALTNTARHASARRAWVRLHVGEESVEVEVVDDGVGLPAQRDRRDGLGLMAMAERAAEVGGTCEAVPVPTGGTAVRAVLPRGEEA